MKARRARVRLRGVGDYFVPLFLGCILGFHPAQARPHTGDRFHTKLHGFIPDYPSSISNAEFAREPSPKDFIITPTVEEGYVDLTTLPDDVSVFIETPHAIPVLVLLSRQRSASLRANCVVTLIFIDEEVSFLEF
ncbi:MAG: hypothetical protein AAF491_08890 [Verrucomicrobiota bacterium]